MVETWEDLFPHLGGGYTSVFVIIHSVEHLCFTYFMYVIFCNKIAKDFFLFVTHFIKDHTAAVRKTYVVF